MTVAITLNETNILLRAKVMFGHDSIQMLYLPFIIGNSPHFLRFQHEKIDFSSFAFFFGSAVAQW